MRGARVLQPLAGRIAGAAAVAALALVSAACGVSDPTTGSGSGSLTSMLGEVPDTPANRSFVAWVDVAAARELAGLPRPVAGKEPDADEALEVFIPGKSGSVQALTPIFIDNRAAELDAWRTEVGFTVDDIDQNIDAGVQPEMTSVARGRFQADQVEEAVSSDPSWKDELETADHDGVEYWRWLDDGEMSPQHVTPTRPLGNSLRLQAGGGQIRWTRTDATMEDAIDAGAGNTDTLADVDELARIATALEDHDAYQAYLSADPGPFSVDRVPRASPEVKEELAADALEPWTAIGAGDAVDGDVAVGVLVLTHDDEEAAATNAERLRKIIESGRSPQSNAPFADVYEVRSLDQEGSTVILTVEQERPQRLLVETIVQRSLALHL
jgi:hypothetical protein